jgi:hypothetical protein
VDGVDKDVGGRRHRRLVADAQLVVNRPPAATCMARSSVRFLMFSFVTVPLSATVLWVVVSSMLLSESILSAASFHFTAAVIDPSCQ